MNEVGRIGIAKFILRETQHLAAVEGIGDALVLSTLLMIRASSSRSSVRTRTASSRMRPIPSRMVPRIRSGMDSS